MTNLEFEILQYINSRHKSVRWLEIMNNFLPFGQSLEADGVLHAMLNAGLLKNTDPVQNPPRCKVGLSDLGLLQFIEENERRQALVCEGKQYYDQMADDRRSEIARRNAEAQSEHKFQLKLSLLNHLISFSLGLLSGLLVPLLISFFH